MPPACVLLDSVYKQHKSFTLVWNETFMAKSVHESSLLLKIDVPFSKKLSFSTYTTISTLFNDVEKIVKKNPSGRKKNLKIGSDAPVPRCNACYQMETSVSVLTHKTHGYPL
jgi:hypothetical protein